MEFGARLVVVSSEPEAEIVRSLLRVNGIRSSERAVDVSTEAGGGLGGWREILVGTDDLEAARELLAAQPLGES